MDLAGETSVAEVFGDLDCESEFFDFFGPDLQELLHYPVDSNGDTVIFDAIVDRHVLPMSGIEVMERALELHESCYEAAHASEMGEQETLPMPHLI